MRSNIKHLYIIAIAATGEGISGSDRIFIELSRRWQKQFPIDLYVWEEGFQMCKKQHLESSNVKFLISKMNSWKKLGFVVNYLARIMEGIKIGLTVKIENKHDIFVYSASEFWMDSLPSFLLKLRFPKIKWAAAWYQTAPNPFTGYTEGTRKQTYKLNALLYWLMQLPVKPLIRVFADFVLVNNDEEKKQFPKAVVVLGAVDLERIKVWQSEFKNLPKIYDSVFQGRFHPQKGVLELIDIWKIVVYKKPDAKLVMIGDGPLMKSVKLKIKSEKLGNNIILTGYLFDGDEKYKVFAQSKIVLHPAFYDSGGMATAEAMAFGLPGIGFDLKSFTSYYPKGLIKISIGNLKGFADQVLNLLQNTKEREKIGQEAQTMVLASWSWDQRAKEVLHKLDKGNIIHE